MTTQILDREPPCPGPAIGPDDADLAPHPATTRLRVEQRPFDAIPRATWDGLAARNPWATPFSEWAFHRAWWDAYGANAHEQTLVVVPSDAPRDGSAAPVAIVPLMHRHEVEPSDAATHTTMRHGTDTELTPVAPDATAIFFGASYHADYATILVAPADAAAVSAALAAYLSGPDAGAWDAIDLRRLRCGDPIAEDLAAALGRGRDRQRLDPQRRARGRLPGRDAAGRCRHRRLPLDPRQEGAPRDPAQGPPRGPLPARSASTTRPTRSPISTPSSTCTRSAGARPACSRRPSVATRAGRCSDGCSSCGAPTAPSAWHS